MPKPGTSRAVASGATEKVLRLQAEQREIRPAIWRTAEARATLSLARRHGVFQVLMGWHDRPLWAFEAKGWRFQAPDPEWDDPARPTILPGKAKLGELLTREGETLRYNYDFGDDWWIQIVVESIGELEPGVR